MRGDIVYRVYGTCAGRAEDTYFGTYRTHGEAQTEATKLAARREWAARHHNRGFVIREVTVETDFEPPSRPAPRDRYVLRLAKKSNGEGRWDSTLVEVLRRGVPDSFERVAEYERNYAMLQTFEPFRQGCNDYAMISRDYTGTAVLDLVTGQVVAEEASDAAGFCPVGFYVPDWWDVHDDSVIPGSKHWGADYEWPTGGFGFVWGCIWGDDSSWKVQYLDLSELRRGVVRRDQRFGYLELATQGDAFREEAGLFSPSRPIPFMRVSSYKGRTNVKFASPLRFDLGTGSMDAWQLKTLNREESGPE